MWVSISRREAGGDPRRRRREYLLTGTGLSHCHTDAKDGVGSKLALVRGTIELDEEVVNIGLFGDDETAFDQGGRDDLVDVLDGGQDTYRRRANLIRTPDKEIEYNNTLTLADVVGLITVTEFDRLVNTSRGARWDGGTEAA